MNNSPLQNLSSKGESFLFDRRQFLKLSAATGLASTFLDVNKLFAQGLCEKVADPEQLTPDQGEGAVNLASDSTFLHYFIDGIQVPGSGAGLPPRGNIALFVNILQTETTFVERVLLTNSNLQTMGARFFDASMKLKSSGHAPYISLIMSN